MEFGMTSGHTRKAANPKGTVTIMEDAPLFAGLEGFVLSHAVEVESVSLPPEKKLKQKAAATRRKIQPETPVSRPVPAAKTHKPPSPGSDAILLTVTEMCTLLNISRATLVRMDNAGRLPGRIKLGGSVRFHRQTVENWLQSLISSNPAP
jgi:excisionase family DNA binding protein